MKVIRPTGGFGTSHAIVSGAAYKIHGNFQCDPVDRSGPRSMIGAVVAADHPSHLFCSAKDTLARTATQALRRKKLGDLKKVAVPEKIAALLRRARSP